MYFKAFLSLLLLISLGFGEPVETSATRESLFEYLARFSMLPYTLLGSKPVSIHYIFHPKLKKNLTVRIFKKLWREFDEDVNKRDYPQFVFKQQADGMIYLIHKQHCLQVIKQNVQLFQNVMGQKSPEEILKIFCSCDSLLDAIHKDDLLLGILLGFGIGNAIAFRYQNERFFLLNEEIPLFNSDEPNDLLLYRLPSFLALESPETHHLRKIYKSEQELIAKIFSEKKASDLFLEKLNEYLPER